MKKVLVLCTIAVFLFGFIGCKNEGKNTVQTNNQGQSEKQSEITLYFPNKEYIISGNESLEKMLPEKRMVNLTGQMKAKVIVEELLKGPSGKGLDKLSSKLKLIDVKVEDNTAFVDFVGEGLSGGSLEEELVVDSIVKSLTEDASIQQVQFLVDGKVAETLMGHLDMSKPVLGKTK